MLLRYQVPSFATAHVDVTNGLTDRLEDFVIKAVQNITSEYKTRRALSMLSDRELSDIGVTRGDIAFIANGTSGLSRG